MHTNSASGPSGGNTDVYMGNRPGFTGATTRENELSRPPVSLLTEETVLDVNTVDSEGRH